MDSQPQPQSRYRRVIVIVGVAVLCAVGAAIVAPHDRAIIDAVSGVSNAAARWLLKAVTDLGNGVTVGLIFVFLLAFRGEKRLAVSGIATTSAAGIICQIIKHVTKRLRPLGGKDAFPSGHTTAAFATAEVLARRYPRLAPLFYLAATAIGVSRVLLLRHYPSDVFAGAALGLVVGLAGCTVAKDLKGSPAGFTARLVGGVLVLALSIYGVWGKDAPTTLMPVLGPILIIASGWRLWRLWKAQPSDAAKTSA